ncbi:TldD/PmbA family protein [soil metagenome]
MPMQDILDRALDVATSEGASYADVRASESSSEALSVRGTVLESLERAESLGYGVRVLVDGAWGYAASAQLDPQAIARTARLAVEVARASAPAMRTRVELVPEPVHRDSWATPVELDPFAVSLDDKIGLLVSAAGAMELVPSVHVGRGTMDLLRERTWFASSEGSLIEQTITHTGGGIEAVAVGNGDVQSRSYPGSFRGRFASGGYEVIDAMALTEHAEATAQEAAALLAAPSCPDEVTTLVISGHQVMLQLHESVGHPTELDRVLGMEAAFAGTSFVGIEDAGSLRYGSELVNITSDATLPGGLGTFAYDDEGVAARSAEVVRDGVLVGFQSSRETAAAIGAHRSNGTMRAEGWANFPLIRMTNLSLLPGEGSLEDLFADVSDGVYMATNKSWAIDDKRKNFQFGCEVAWEIKRGRLGRMLKNPRYTGMTTEFWSSCDAIAGATEWEMRGTPNCGKGQPGQSMRVGHGTSPARFRNVSIGVTQ